jgi:zinc-binding alcohol dehydrogenase family protein
MRAVGYRAAAALGEPAYLLDLELPDPVPEARDLWVAVEAIAVNPVDLKVRARELPPADQCRVLGWDGVGRVLAVGDQVRGFSAGDRVWYAGALQRPGCNAERQLVDHRLAALAPRNLEPAAAAALPLTAITAWELLFTRLALAQTPTAGQGETLLVLGGAGGVGSILVQLARQLTGLTVVATASRPGSRAWAEAMGAHQVLDHSQPLQPQLRALGLPAPSRVASLSHSGEHFAALVELLAPQGALALIDDPAPEAINVLALKRKSLSLHWEFMFTRSLIGTADLAEQGRLLARVAELVEQGVLRSTMAEQLGPITAASLQQAHQRLASGHGRGKVVLAGFG